MLHKTVCDVAMQLEEAVKTLRMLPPADLPRMSVGQWPDYIRNYWELWRQYGGESAYEERERTLRIRPTSFQIDRMNEAIQWYFLLPRETFQIIWARASNYSWRRIASITGKSPNTCRGRFRVGITALTYRINEKTSCTDCTLGANMGNRIEALSL